ncbi:FkbM family methyltransferase [Pelagibacteraceae bacterium]|jgi:FkbM family methyltransferase|nr:FkbM family methyltransferase [Pelagibacteraceae bacterium]MDC1130350.1 FkbM family methyltransferase [Pelagibacteraceae bacterium]
MLKNKSMKLSRSLLKIILPIIFKILIKLKLNRRVINFLNDRSYNSNNYYDFTKIIQNILNDKKIVALDIGAQGGFNSDNFFPKKYNCFFDEVLIEPIEAEANKLKKNKYVINKGIWSKQEKKKLFILDNRLGSSSMYQPNTKNFDLHNIKKDNYKNYDITRTVEINCDTINSLLSELNLNNLDYLKIDTQGAELEILNGLGNYKPLLIKIEAHIFSMYKDVPSWHKLLNLLYELNYVVVDWKGIGEHNSRVPAEIDMILIPNFDNNHGKSLIINSKEKFISLMLIFGQLNLLKLILKRFNIDIVDLEKFEDLYFN